MGRDGRNGSRGNAKKNCQGSKSMLRVLSSVSNTLDQKSVSQGNSRTYGDGWQEIACSDDKSHSYLDFFLLVWNLLNELCRALYTAIGHVWHI